MVKLTEAEKEFIREHLKPELIQAGHVNDILDPLDDWITANGFDDNYDLTDEGCIAQRMYDNIYYRNVKPDES